jgi:hypothetical protein
MILGGIRYSITCALGVIFATAILFSSCAKNGVELPVPLSSYNLSAYTNDELLTFNATATDYGDSVFDIQGTWVTNIGETYQLDMMHIKLSKVGYYVGTYYLTQSPQGTYSAYKTGSSSTSYIFDYYTTPSFNGALIINKFNSTARTITGTFSFTGYNYSTSNSININHGSFTNLKLTP